MEFASRLAILADAAKYDASCASSGSSERRPRGGRGIGSTEGMGICHSYTPDGRCVSLLKILLTNACIFDCSYCINRRSSNVRRARFTPEEVVRLTLDFYRRNYIEGLFLSSGIVKNSDHTMEQLVRVARALREEHGFAGYIHLKTIPDASPELIREAGRWADRLSINVELPTQADLDRLAPEKRLVQITGAMGEIRDGIVTATAARRSDGSPRSFAPAGQSTQMIVGATDATDATILQTASSLYREQRLRRVYYSAFSPIPDSSPHLPSRPPPLLRENRLYQADWLIRFYGFEAEEIAPASAPDLDLHLDPKTTWALRNRDRFPLDVNRAERSELLRVPGLGVRNVEKILRIRRWHSLRLADLRTLGVRMRRSGPFLIATDHAPGPLRLDAADLRERLLPNRGQIDLWDTAVSARHGEL
jgi:putative DNA modification/repair radical SAM protein